jgi:hypothetical protein
MKLFSRISFICNLGFLVFVVLGFIELNRSANKRGGGIIPLPFVTGTLVILGQLAIFVNLVFCLVTAGRRASRKPVAVPKWLLAANFMFLILEVYYFFI